MSKENPLRALLSQLNQQYQLSDQFKTRVAKLIDRIEGLNLRPEQLEILAGKVKDTYERQVLVESCREESRKSMEKMQGAIAAYSNALHNINQRLQEAETALDSLLNSKPASSRASEERGILLIDKERAKVLAA